jgi:tryptophan synthase beta chain
MDERQIVLGASELPDAWYNLRADLPEPPAPYLHPATAQPVTPDDLAPLFPASLIAQEMSTERWIGIPDPVREKLSIWRPTPLVRALHLERELRTPARIYYKNESVSPAGSHKPNSAVAQAYYNAEAGVPRLATETGAGQWGSSLAFASQLFGLECDVYMVRVSYEQKPYRRTMMETWGARVVASPSQETASGRKILAEDPDSSGSLGIAISEAVEVAAGRDDTHYALGSVLNHVCLHQTVIGLEVQKQLALAGETPDLLIGCAGGGSNFAGFAFPFVSETLAGRGPGLLAVEPSACPTLTRGRYAYDYGDTEGLTPLTPMYTLGHSFVPPGIHAGGLRYHGMSSLVSWLRRRGALEARAYPQREVFDAALLFTRCEGILPAPETAHAIRAVIEEAQRCRETNTEACIVFNLSGHGHFDLAAYQGHLAGDLLDRELDAGELERGLRQLPNAPTELL